MKNMEAKSIEDDASGLSTEFVYAPGMCQRLGNNLAAYQSKATLALILHPDGRNESILISVEK